MSIRFDWTCPYCRHAATLTRENCSVNVSCFDNGAKVGPLAVRWLALTCPRPQCRQVELRCQLFDAVSQNGQLKASKTIIEEWQLMPASTAEVFPDYIPEPIRKDYEESCRIRDLSPKASATLARRCLQGMIRDFHKITRNRLFDEIAALKGVVDDTTWMGIDAVRQVGNIGTHMQQDINVIVDVDPGEAQLLIGLIERLLKEWYVAREERDRHMKSLVALADAKKGKGEGHD